MTRQDPLPFVDEHAATIAAPRAAVWGALERYLAGALLKREGHLLARMLGTRPPAGFAVAAREPETRLVLAGRHRFARYELAFELRDAPGGTQVAARSSAAFPGARGRAYRALVIGSRGHVLAVRRMLRAIGRLSTERGAAG